MATEPERPIEKLLRACARKRRDEAGEPFALHPATRRLLQGEVTGAFARDKCPADSFSRLLARLWPRVAWGVALFAVLAIAVWVLIPGASKGQKEALLAKNELAAEAARAKALAPPPAAVPEPVSAPPEAAARAAKAVSADADRAASRQVPTPHAFGANYAAPAKARPEAPVETAAAERVAPVTRVPNDDFKTDEAQKQLAESTSNLAPTRKAVAVTALPAAAPASAGISKDRSGSVVLASKQANGFGGVQGFSPAAQESKAKNRFADQVSPAQSVLAAFRMEQTGSELRIVDGDGSVYSGYLQIANGTRRLGLVSADKPAAARALKAPKANAETETADALRAEEQAGYDYFFRVAGTNRSLSQKVVFTGALMAATNVTLLTKATNAWSSQPAVGGAQTAGSLRARLLLPNGRISGKAMIGDRKAIEIHAVPAIPSADMPSSP